jgi:two-component system, NtrC family, sensor histidine kinase PilS
VSLVESAALLRAFAGARLALAGVLAVVVPFTPSARAPDAGLPVLAWALVAAGASSFAILLRRTVPHPRRVAALLSTLDVVLITAVVAATGGPASIYPFLYVLSVTAACVLLPRAGGLAIAGAAALLYSGLVLGRTVFPIAYFFEAPQDTTALDVVTMFMNAATFLTVAIVAGGVAERYRTTHQELETRQRDLRDLQAFRDLVFDCVGTGLAVLDPDYRVTAFNRAAAGITGRSDAGLLGVAWTDVVDGLDLVAIGDSLRDPALASVRRETNVRRLDGTVAPVLMTFSALRSGAGDMLGLIAACEDLSALRDMEARMRHADRLATLGRMSANIAHEIRNPLASMTGAIEALTGSAGFAPDERDKLTSIVSRESARLNRIVSEFLAYARPSPLTRDRTDVAALVEDVLTLLEHRPLPDSVKLVRTFSGPLWADVDSGALRQALWNLCLNAVQAMPAGGALTVGATDSPAALEVEVKDTGGGITRADLAHIFEPFFSTKPEGSGLGLALVHRVVRDHGGDIDVRTEPGVGTAFVLTLPKTAYA